MVIGWVHSDASGADDAAQDEQLPGTTASFRPSTGDRLPDCMALKPGMAGQVPPDSHLVAVDFENVDLRIFIKFVSK
jgi:hypothetical protein